MGANDNPKISIIMPVYNSEKYLRECIDSILNQTFTDFELILIDDGSTDCSGKICDEFYKVDKRVVVRHKENEGICSARNIGLDIARGDYIGFSDCDDLMNKYMYENLYNAIINENADIAFCYCNTFSVEEIDCEDKIEAHFRIIDKDNIYRNLYGQGNIDYKYMVFWNKLIDKNLFKNIRFDDNGAEDLDVTNRLFNISKKTILTETPMYFWRQHNLSESHKRFNKRNIAVLSTYIKCFNYLIDNKKNKYADMCIYKWIKVSLNNRYNSKNSEYESDVKEITNSQFKQYYKVFFKSKYISTKDKIIFSVFRFMPFTYDLFRKIIEA